MSCVVALDCGIVPRTVPFFAVKGVQLGKVVYIGNLGRVDNPLLHVLVDYDFPFSSDRRHC